MQQFFVIQHVRIFDGKQIIPQNTVVVENGLITAVGEDIPPPRGARVIDGSGQTLLPGLIDAHTHVWNAQSLEQALTTLTFVADSNWQQYTFTFDQFGLSEMERLQVRFIVFAAGPKAGPFAFYIDHVSLFS